MTTKRLVASAISLGLTYAMIGEKLGVSIDMVGRWASGRSAASAGQRDALAKIVVDTRKFFRFVDRETARIEAEKTK